MYPSYRNQSIYFQCKLDLCLNFYLWERSIANGSNKFSEKGLRKIKGNFQLNELIFNEKETKCKYTSASLPVQKQPPEVFCKKKLFLEILQNSQENTCARVSFLI